MVELNNKKILVMGATGGIGRETAITLSKLGAKIVVSGRDEAKLEKTLSLLIGEGHYSLVFDIREIADVKDFMSAVVTLDNKKLSGVVYSTGVIPVRPIKNTSYDFLHDVMTVNYYGFVEVVRHFSNRKYSNGGSVVALSSYASINGDKGQLAYAASKGAIDSSVIVMAKELHAKGIRVNAIRPAVVSYENIDEDDLLPGTQDIIDRMLTGAIDPVNIAEQIAFLLSDYSSGVYGRCFDVRGYLS